LDLKMPVRDGFSVLEWLNTQKYEKLVVVILTDSMEPAHIKRALDLGADRFQVKPKSAHERHAMMLALEEYLQMCFNDFPPDDGEPQPSPARVGAAKANKRPARSGPTFGALEGSVEASPA
jgi:hypothetical protein